MQKKGFKRQSNMELKKQVLGINLRSIMKSPQKK